MFGNQLLSPSCFSSTDRTTASWFGPIWSDFYPLAGIAPIVGLDFDKIVAQQRLSLATANLVDAAPNWWHLSDQAHDGLANRRFPYPFFQMPPIQYQPGLGILGFGQLANPSSPISQDN